MLNWIKQNLPPGIKKYLKALYRPSHMVVLPFPASYDEDGFATVHNCDFIKDPLFMRAYEKGMETGSWKNIRWRAHVYSWFALQAFRLKGDFVECGVNRGGYARMVYEYMPFSESDKRFYLLDTFNGFDLDLLSNDEIGLGIPEAYNYTECYEQVLQTFSPFANAVVVRGKIPDTLEKVESKEISFLSIDMNCVEPEIAAANHFWDRLVSGGIMLLDDYGHPLHINQKIAFDRFAKEKNVRILHLPTEQGVIMKP
jgi:O-methyltransferase